VACQSRLTPRCRHTTLPRLLQADVAHILDQHKQALGSHSLDGGGVGPARGEGAGSAPGSPLQTPQWDMMAGVVAPRRQRAATLHAHAPRGHDPPSPPPPLSCAGAFTPGQGACANGPLAVSSGIFSPFSSFQRATAAGAGGAASSTATGDAAAAVSCCAGRALWAAQRTAAMHAMLAGSGEGAPGSSSSSSTAGASEPPRAARDDCTRQQQCSSTRPARSGSWRHAAAAARSFGVEFARHSSSTRRSSSSSSNSELACVALLVRRANEPVVCAHAHAHAARALC
jgi:hypothetical protein